MKKVIVTADAAGNVIVPSKTNAEWGHIRVKQERVVIDARGFGKVKTVSALVPGKIADLVKFGWADGQELDGKVVFKEQTVPFTAKDKNPERDYKIAGESGVLCRIDGKPIYRKSFYTTDTSAGDVTVDHDNIEEIKAAYALMEKEGKLKKTEGIDAV